MKPAAPPGLRTSGKALWSSVVDEFDLVQHELLGVVADPELLPRQPALHGCAHAGSPRSCSGERSGGEELRGVVSGSPRSCSGERSGGQELRGVLMRVLIVVSFPRLAARPGRARRASR